MNEVKVETVYPYRSKHMQFTLKGTAKLDPRHVRQAIIHWVAASREAFDLDEMLRTGRVKINSDASAVVEWEER